MWLPGRWRSWSSPSACDRGAFRAPRSPVGWSWQPRARLPSGSEPRAGLRERPSRRLRDYLPHPRAGGRHPRRCPDRKRQPPALTRSTAASRPSRPPAEASATRNLRGPS